MGHSRRVRKYEGTRVVCVFRGQKSGSIGLCGAYVCSPTLEGRSTGRGARCFHSFLRGAWNALGGFVGISLAVPLHSLMHFMPHPSIHATNTNKLQTLPVASQKKTYLLALPNFFRQFHPSYTTKSSFSPVLKIGLPHYYSPTPQLIQPSNN